MTEVVPIIRERSLVRCLIVDTDNHQTLLLKRSAEETFGVGEWEVLQGSREAGETPDEGVLREIEEEINIRQMQVLIACDPADAQAPGVLGLVSTDHFAIEDRRAKDTIQDWSNINYLLGLPGISQAKITLDDSHDDYQWVSLDDARAILAASEYSAAGVRLIDGLYRARERARRMVKLLDAMDLSRCEENLNARAAAAAQDSVTH